MRESRSPIYYGWLVLAASMVCELLVMGATAYAAGLFVLPLQAEFHIGRAQANSAVSFLFLGTMLMGPIVGRALDRFSIRTVMPIGAVIFAGTLTLISFSHSLVLMALLLILPGAIGFLAVGPVNTSTLATRWFFRRRGLVLGIAAVATSGGALLTAPLAWAIDHYGWRSALLYEAMVIGTIIMLLTLVIRDRPADLSLQDHPENQGRMAVPQGALRWSAILGRRDFWIPALTLITSSGLSQAVVTTVPVYAIQLGYAASRTQMLFAFALAAGLTKIGAGLLADRLPPRLLLVSACLLMMASQLSLWLAPSADGLVAGSALAGASLGCALPTAGRMLAAAFGASHFGAVMGWTYAGMSAAAIAAPLFSGHVYDADHSYAAAFITFIAVSAAVLCIVAFLKPGARA